jgi:hypothetical protein
MENLFGGLLEFEKNKDFEDFISKIDYESAVKIIELSILYGQNNGMFNLPESHCLYICLKKLKEKDESIG